MGKNKGSRVVVTLECDCRNNKKEKRKNGICRYTTTKNKRNTPNRLEIRKFCKYCNEHQTLKEIK